MFRMRILNLRDRLTSSTSTRKQDSMRQPSHWARVLLCREAEELFQGAVIVDVGGSTLQGPPEELGLFQPARSAKGTNSTATGTQT